MSNDQPLECIKVDFDDLTKYVDSQNLEATEHPPHQITNLLLLKSELVTAGLKSLYDSLNSSVLLKSELVTDELKSLYDARNPSNEVAIAQLKKNYASRLLKDLEKLSKRQDFNRHREAPLFKKEFYDEINKPIEQRSVEAQTFLQYCANLIQPDNSHGQNSLTVSEAISAKMLLKLDEKDITKDALLETLKSELDHYKEQLKDQTEKDIGTITNDGRSVILLKDQSGVTKILDVKTLSEETSLTGEQKDFVKSAWHQGTFGSGWCAINANTNHFQKKMQELYPQGVPHLNGHNDFLMIDTSKPGEVKIYNRTPVGIFVDPSNEDNPHKTVDYIQGTLEVDISALKAREYVPGCASAKPTINAYITKFNKEIDYDLPRELTISKSLNYDKIRQDLIKSSTDTELSEIVAQGKYAEKALRSFKDKFGQENAAKLIFDNIVNSKLNIDDQKSIVHQVTNLSWEKNFFANYVKTSMAELHAHNTINSNIEGTYELFNAMRIAHNQSPINIASQDLLAAGLEQKIAVEYYSQMEADSKEVEKFAGKQLDKYCENQEIHILDEKETSRIKNGITSILAPLCKNRKDKALLENNASMIVRECACIAGTEMSFGQKWKTYILDPIKRVFGRENQVQQLIAQHPEITKALKHLMTKQKKNKKDQHYSAAALKHDKNIVSNKGL